MNKGALKMCLVNIQAAIAARGMGPYQVRFVDEDQVKHYLFAEGDYTGILDRAI